MREVFEYLFHNYSKKWEEQPSAWALLMKEVAQQALRAYEPTTKVVWTSSYAFPMEMFRPLGLIPFDFELMAGLLTAGGMGEKALALSEKLGLPMDTCSAHRIAMGATFGEMYPKPDLLVTTTHLCDGKAKCNEYMADHYGIDYVLLDVPSSQDDGSLEYVGSQLQGIFKTLCDFAKHECDEQMLFEPISAFNEMTEHLKRANRIRRQRPSPGLPRNRGFNILFFSTLLFGTQDSVKIMEMFADELEEMIREDEGSEERFRLLWLMASPSYRNNVFETLESFGARIVVEEFGHPFWEPLDEKAPFRSFAKRIFQNPLNGSTDKRIESLDHLIRDYEVDGAVNFCHLACRQSNGAIYAIRDFLKEKGIHLMNIEADLNDKSTFSPKRVRDYIHSCMEILEAKKPSGK